ncbi:MAG TPA: hypothetical protein VGC54_09875 [Planctomycetota bacterium]
MLYRRRPSAFSIVALLAAGCAATSAESAPRVGSFAPPAPLDVLARTAAAELLGTPSRIDLAGANGLERLAVRLQDECWIAEARAPFFARLADPAPLDDRDADAFAERWSELDLDPRWRDRLRTEGRRTVLERPDPWTALADLQVAAASADPNRLLAAWGRAHAWFGHVWLDGSSAAIAFDGFDLEFGIEPSADAGAAGDGHPEPGWHLSDRLGVDREFTVRRAGGQASMRYAAAGQRQFVPAQLPGEVHDHAGG